MQDAPDPSALLGIVSEFLRASVLPELTGHTAYHLRVAVSALAIVQRQIAQGPSPDEQETERLVALIGDGGDLRTLNERLCAAISSGAIPLDNDALRRHLWRTTLDKMAVDQPKYSAYVAEQAGGGS